VADTKILMVLFCFVSLFGFSQLKDSIPDKGIDSVKTDLRKRGIVLQEGTIVKKEINPLAPSRAAFYSAVLPGLGQIYNKRYWKVPIVFGALGLSISTYSFNNTEYRRVLNAFKRRQAGFTDDEFFDRNGDGVGPDFSDTALEDAQERFQRNRDLALLITIGLYAFNIIDANVDAHLKQYNVSDQLGMDIKPYLDLNQITGTPVYGLAMEVKF